MILVALLVLVVDVSTTCFNPDLSLWYADALTKVFPNTPVPHSSRQPLLFSARQEHAVFQAVITNAGHTTVGSIQVKAPSSVQFNTNLVAFTNVTFGVSPPSHKTGLFPDPLPPLYSSTPITLHTNTSQPIWVSVYPTRAAPTGNHTIQVQLVIPTQSIACRLTVTLHVHNITLPTHGTMVASSGFGEHGELKNPETLRRWYKDMANHRVNSLLFRNMEPFMEVNWAPDLSSVALNTTEWDMVADWLVTELHFSKFMFPAPAGCTFRIGPSHYITPNDTWSFGTRKTTVKIFTDDSTPQSLQFNPVFTKLWKMMNFKIVHHLVKKGWLGPTSRHRQTTTKPPTVQIYSEFKDEPSFNDAFTLAAWLKLAELYTTLHKDIKGYQTRFPVPSRPETYKYIQHWCPHVSQWNNLTARRELTQLVKTRGVELTMYDNGIPIIDMPSIRTQTFPWALWETNGLSNYSRPYGLQGSLSWPDINSWQGLNPWVHPNLPGHKIPKDAAGFIWLEYPSLNGDNEPVDSIRWNLYMKGLEDTEYFYILDALIDRCEQELLPTPTSHNTAQAKQALQNITRVVWGCASDWWAVHKFANGVYTTNIDLLHQSKLAIAIAIEKLQVSC